MPYSEDWSSRERLAILAMCNKLSATIGGCERLVQTPVPLHYVRHTSRFLTIWCFLLPLVIGERLCFATVTTASAADVLVHLIYAFVIVKGFFFVGFRMYE